MRFKSNRITVILPLAILLLVLYAVSESEAISSNRAEGKLINNIAINGSIVHAKLNEKIGRIYLEVADASDSNRIKIYDIYTGNQVLVIPSANCPSFDKNGSVFTYWDTNKEEAVLNKIYNNEIKELGRFESAHRPCPTISQDANVVALDRGFPNDMDGDGYELLLYRLSNFFKGSGNVTSDSTLIKSDRGCDEECFVYNLQLTSNGDKILFNLVIENDEDYTGRLFVAESKDNFVPRLLQKLSTQMAPYGTMSSNGKAVVFQSSDSSDNEIDNEIYMINLEDNKLTKLTDNTANDYMPRISHDGKKIVFWHDNDIYEIVPSSGNAKARTIVSNVKIAPDSFHNPILEIGKDIMMYSTNNDTNNTVILVNITR